jgi:hypothetical protein
MTRVLAALSELGARKPGARTECVPRARELLTHELCVSLAAQFADEESESYFGVIAREAPWLAREIDGMRDEHRRLLACLSGLILEASDGAHAGTLAWGAERLTLLLELHERKEGYLLRRFLHSTGTEA